MIPVFQRPMDGQCMRASICSIFELPIEKGPQVSCEGHFWNAEEKEFQCSILEHRYKSYTDDKGVDHYRYRCDGSDSQDKWINEWLSRFGLVMSSMYVDTSQRSAGPRPHGEYRLLPPGLCIATGRSPRFSGNHAVVWDTRLTDFEHTMGRMVHDPNPSPEGERPGLGNVERFHFFEIVDPAKLGELSKLREASQ